MADAASACDLSLTRCAWPRETLSKSGDTQQSSIRSLQKFPSIAAIQAAPEFQRVRSIVAQRRCRQLCRIEVAAASVGKQ